MMDDDAPAVPDQPTAGADPARTLPEPEAGDRLDAQPGARLGRYQLLTLVGAGGMGIVWGAWDPVLERRVAIKLLQESRDAARSRVRREGQTLARAAHPNIVPVFDVGELGTTLYLVMEWVSGVTLRAFAATRPGWRAILDAYRQAGLGLAAAHRAGVVHRDFKPENAMRGDDGRVRVLDFGLAFAADSDASVRHAGTARYMAPEQVRGDTVTAAADQFAFAVALGEALASAGEVPAWIATALTRARADDPTARFASIDELLAVLARDPAQRRRRLLLAAGAAAAATAAFVIGGARAHPPAAPPIEVCTGAVDELAPQWGPPRRAATLDHLAAVMPPPQVALVRDAIDGFATNWAAAHRAACLGNHRGELTSRLYEARRTCLARTHARLGAVTELLATVDAAGADGAVTAARALPDVTACADDPTVVPPPAAIADAVVTATADVERALVHVQADSADATALATAATAAARRLGYAPLLAHALQVEGRARMYAAPPELAEALLDEAVTVALAAADDVTAVEAFARWLFVRAIYGHTDAASWPVMKVLAERLGPRGRFAHALLLHNRALVEFAAGDLAGGRTRLREALAVRGDVTDPELLCIETSIGAFSDDPAESAALWTSLVERTTQLLGPDHQATLRARLNRSYAIHDARRAYAELTAVCPRMVRPREQQGCNFERAWLAEAIGDRSAALAAMREVGGPDITPQQQAIAVAFVAVGERRVDADRLLAVVRTAADAPATDAVWHRADQVARRVLLAWAADQRAPAAAATAAWAAVLAVDVKTPGPLQRQLAQARATLAERWADRQPVRARQLAIDALAWYRDSPSDAALVARLERIAAAR